MPRLRGRYFPARENSLAADSRAAWWFYIVAHIKCPSVTDSFSLAVRSGRLGIVYAGGPVLIWEILQGTERTFEWIRSQLY